MQGSRILLNHSHLRSEAPGSDEPRPHGMNRWARWRRPQWDAQHPASAFRPVLFYGTLSIPVGSFEIQSGRTGMRTKWFPIPHPQHASHPSPITSRKAFHDLIRHPHKSSPIPHRRDSIRLKKHVEMRSSREKTRSAFHLFHHLGELLRGCIGAG